MMTIRNGQCIDRYIPRRVKHMFYRNPNPAHQYAIRNGYDPYGFPTDGLVLYLPLWALKGDAFESVDAHQYICTVTGAEWRPVGRVLDGNDVLALSNAFVTAYAGATSGSFVIWFTLTAIDRVNPLLYFGDNATNNNVHELSVEADNTVRVLNKDVADHYRGTFNPALAANTPYCLGFTVDAGGNIMYWNGVAQGVAYTAGNAASTEFMDDLAGIDTFMLGEAEFVAAAFMIGFLHEVWFYNGRALSAAEMLDIYNRTRWRYP